MKMDSVDYLNKFWSSLLSDSEMQKQLKGLMDIEDPEERAIQIICRTLFLLVMEMKHERDEAIKRVDEIHMSDPGQLFSLAKGEGNKKEDCGKGSKSRFVVVCERTEETTVKQTKAVKHIDEHDDELAPNREAIKSQKMSNKSYRCLSRTSPQNGQNSPQNTTDAGKEMSLKILAPETLSLDEIDFHINVEKRKAFATETVSVPETMAMDTNVAADGYGNTDFFESNLETESLTKASDPQVHENSPYFKSPLKNQMVSLESDSDHSPVLGKQNNVTPKNSKKLKLNMSKLCDFESPQKTPLQPLNINTSLDPDMPKATHSLNINTEDLVEENLIPQEASTPRYSPLVFTRNLSSSIGDMEYTSPSLLPSVITVKSRKKCDENSPVKPVACQKEQDGDIQGVSKTNSLRKTVSSFSAISPKEKSRVLRRHHSDDKECKGKWYSVHVEPIDPNKKLKKYKQARISEMTLVPKTDVAKITGGVPKMTFDDEVSAALKASLKTKAVEDMMRKKHSELHSGTSSKDIPSSDAIAKDENFKTKAQSKDIALVSDEQNFKLPDPKSGSLGKVKKNSTSKSSSKSLKNCIGSPRKKCAGEKDISGLSKKRRRESEASGNEDEKIIGLDDLLEQVNDSPSAHVSKKDGAKSAKIQKLLPNSSATGETGLGDETRNVRKTVLGKADQWKKSKSPPKKALAKKASTVHEDSFDIVPAKNNDLDYAYREDAVRKKASRKQLEGWQCHECKDWYEGAELEPEKKKMLMNKCSRHRSKYNPITNTPKNFWNPDWIDDSEDSA